MIHRFHSNTVANLRDYQPEDQQVAGDIVLYVSTVGDDDFNGMKNSAFFRLVDNYDTSGEVDDGVIIFASNVIPNHYWEKVQKGMVRGEYSAITYMAVNDTLTLTHSADPDYKRYPSLAIIFPVNVQETISIDADTFSEWDPAASQVAFPLYAGNLSSGIRLNSALEMVKLGQVDIAAGVLADLGLTLTEYASFIYHYGDNEVIVGYNVSEDSTFRYAILHKDTFAYRMSFTKNPSSDCVVGRFTNNKQILHVEESRFYVSTLDESANYLDITDTQGAWGDWIPKYRARVQEDCVIAIHFYHDIETYWSLYETNPRDHRIHFSNGDGTFQDGGSPLNYIGNIPNGTSLAYTRFSTDTVIWRIMYQGVFKEYNLVNSSGHFANLLTGSPYAESAIIGSWFFYDDSVSIITNCPYVGEQTIMRFTKVTGGTDYTQFVESERLPYLNPRAYNPTDQPKNFSYGNYFSGKYYILSSAAGWTSNIYTKDPDTDAMVAIGDLRQVPWEDDYYNLEMGTYNYVCDVGNEEWFIQPDGKTTGPYKFKLQEKTVNKYVSSGCKFQVTVNAVGITDITINATVPANTGLTVHVSDTSNGDLYVYNTGTTNWEVQNDYTQGMTLAEFHAADVTKLPAQVGQNIEVYLYLITNDGVSTPVITSIDVDYFQGNDAWFFNDLSVGSANFTCEYLSPTTSRIQNITNNEYYVKFGVHFLE